MKIYSYTANQDGHEDGVFGGVGVREQKGQHIPNLGNNPGSSGGLFGFGMTHFESSSLFNTSSVQFSNDDKSPMSQPIVTIFLHPK